MNWLKRMAKNYKTSLAGIGMICSGVANVASGDRSLESFGLIAGGIGLLKAKDSDVTGGTRPAA